jgi:hypothetical protein
MTQQTKRELINAAKAALTSGPLHPPLRKQLLEAIQKAELVHERDETDEKYFQTAREKLTKEGSLEFDDDAVVSISEEKGAYVECWIWIDDETAGIDRLIGRRFKSARIMRSEPFADYDKSSTVVTLAAGMVFKVISKDEIDNYRVDWEGDAEVVEVASGARQTIPAAGAYSFFAEDEVLACLEVEDEPHAAPVV